MAKLPTNYVDDVLDSSVTHRQYNMSSNSNGTVSLVDVTPYSVTGSDFGADDLNATNTQVNKNTDALNGIKFSYNADDGHFYATAGTHSKKLGSSEGTATTADVLSGVTFGSANYDDVATGTMSNKKGGTVTATSVTNATDSYSYIKIPSAGYYDTTSTVKVANKSLVNANPNMPKVFYLGKGTSFNVTSLADTYGFDYTKLTTANFVGWEGSATGGGGSACNATFGGTVKTWDHGDSVNTSRSASYNNSNGVLTISGGSNSREGSWDQYSEDYFWGNARANVSMTAPKVYLVIGNIATS